MIRLFENRSSRRKRLSSVRCVFCDLDGTLLTNQNEIHPAVTEHAQALRRRGIRLILASGRTDGFTRQYARVLDPDAPVISLNGSLVRRVDGTVLDQHPLPSSVFKVMEQLQHTVEGASLSWTLFTAEGTMSLDEVPVLPRYLRAREEEIHRVQSLQPYAEHAVALCAGGPYRSIQKLSVTLARKYGPRLQRVTYQSGSGTDRYYIEVRLRHVTKATGVRAVLSELHLNRKQSASIGDYTNDLEMCKFTGVSAAMRNGNDAIRAEADFIMQKNNDEGGAAEFFRMILRRDPRTR